MSLNHLDIIFVFISFLVKYIIYFFNKSVCLSIGVFIAKIFISYKCLTIEMVKSLGVELQPELKFAYTEFLTINH